MFSQKKLKSAALKVHLAEVIINALRYNPVLALSCMESLQFTQYFFQFWFKNLELFTRVHDKKLCILALCSILSLPQLPDILQNQMGLLFDGVLDMLKSYPEAVEIRQTQEALEHGSSQGYEEDDEFIDDGPIDTQEYDAEFEDTGYLEQLSSTAASYQLDDESEDDWSVCDFMEEDVYLLTPLDSIDVYKTFLSLVQNLETRGLGSMIAGNLSQEKQAVVTMAIKSAQQSK